MYGEREFHKVIAMNPGKTVKPVIKQHKINIAVKRPLKPLISIIPREESECFNC
jgi:hypothetical protein